MLGARRYDIQAVLISVRNGETGYHTQWMTRDASLCKAPPEPGPNGMLRCDGDLEKVRGRTVAFTDPNSTTGYLFPAQQLFKLGIDPERDYPGGPLAGIELQERLESLQADLPPAFPQVRFVIRGLTQGPPVNAPLELRLVGQDIDALRRAGYRLP